MSSKLWFALVAMIVVGLSNEAGAQCTDCAQPMVPGIAAENEFPAPIARSERCLAFPGSPNIQPGDLGESSYLGSCICNACRMDSPEPGTGVTPDASGLVRVGGFCTITYSETVGTEYCVQIATSGGVTLGIPGVGSIGGGVSGATRFCRSTMVTNSTSATVTCHPGTRVQGLVLEYSQEILVSIPVEYKKRYVWVQPPSVIGLIEMVDCATLTHSGLGTQSTYEVVYDSLGCP